MRGKKLGMKVMAGLLFLAVILMLCTCLAVGGEYLKEETESYNQIAFSYARTAAEYIDGDRVLSYLKTGRKDDYYRQIQDFLNASQGQTDLKYYYVFVPCEEDLVYIWDAEREEGACPLGWHEAYMEGGREAVREIYRENPPEKITITDDAEYGYIASAFSPIFDSRGEPIAVVGVDLSVPKIKRALRYFIHTVILSVAGVILPAMGAFYAFMRKNIIAPVRLLNEAAKAMTDSLEMENPFRADIRTGDEIEELAGSFEQMSVELRDYIRRLTKVTAEKERIGAELDVAAGIQSSMLPCIFPAFPERQEVDIYASMNPAREVGGDFYDFFMVDDRHLAIVMADVSGKGVPAALFMVIGKTLIKDHTLPGRDLGAVFTRVNDLLCESNSEGLFITAFEGVLDLVTGEFCFVNAGHELPFICRRDETFMPYRTRAGFVLAGMEGTGYQADSIRLNPGDKLFQYTDGVTEAADGSNRLYGMERLAKVLQENARRAPMELLPAVKADIDAFVGEVPQSDDITMLCLEYKGRTDREPEILTADAAVENIAKVTDFVNRQLKRRKCPAKVQNQIDIAVDELFGNIARYAYGTQGGEVVIQAEFTEDPPAVRLTFIDRGTPFDPLSEADPDVSLAAEERQPGGLGIYIVKQSMDEVFYEYRDGKNILRISKNFCEERPEIALGEKVPGVEDREFMGVGGKQI